MEAIILAGGKGSRLRSLVSNVPKPMAPIDGRPFLEWIMKQLYRYQFRRIILSTGYLGEHIQSYFGSRFENMEISYVHEVIPLGTGGAIKEAMRVCKEDHVYIINGDTFQFLDFFKIEQHWEKYRNPIIIGTEVADISRYGALILKNDKVIGFSEKGKNGIGYINTGYYVFNNEQIKRFPEKLAFSLEQDFLQNEVTHQIYDFIKSKGNFIDIGIPEDYHRAQKELKLLKF